MNAPRTALRGHARMHARRGPLRGRLVAGTAGRELLVTLSRPRATTMRVLVPLLLAVPLSAGGAPTFWAAMLLTVLVAMVGAVGCGMTLARARACGFVDRLSVVPGHPWRIVGCWVSAGALVDALQLLPALLVVVVAGGATATAVLALLCSTVAALLVANVIGCTLALVAGGAAEVLLDVAVVLAPLLFLGGLFTGVPRSGWRWVVACIDPFAHLQAAFIATLGGTPAFDSTAVLGGAAAWLLVCVAALAPLGGAMLRRPR